MESKIFLHVGCGPQYKDSTTRGFNTEAWKELRLDINGDVEPDFVGSMTDMSAVSDASIDAIYSSHNIEHLYPHEVPVALAEFMRVLRSKGFVIITCPDLQSVCALVADGKLLEPAYISASGPIAPLDVLYGFRPAMMAGNLYMAHRCGFTLDVLLATLKAAGCGQVAGMQRGAPYFDLWVVGAKQNMSDEAIRELALEHFPI